MIGSVTLRDPSLQWGGEAASRRGKLLEEGHGFSRADFSGWADMPDMPDRSAGNARDVVARVWTSQDLSHPPFGNRRRRIALGGFSGQVGLPHGRLLHSASILPSLFHVNRHSSRKQCLLSSYEVSDTNFECYGILPILRSLNLKKTGDNCENC